MTQNLFSVTCAATIITSALKAICTQCWISVTDNKVSAGVKSPLWEERNQANFRSLRFVEVTLSEIPSVCAPLLAWSYHLIQVSHNYVVEFGESQLLSRRTFKMMVCAETL